LLVKNLNYRHAVFRLGYLRKAKFYLESKALFIDISIIASFDCLVAGILRFFGQFRGLLEVFASAKIHPVRNYFPKKTRVPLSNFFSSSNMFFIRLFLANT